MPDFTFVTYDGLPDLDPDDRYAVDALARRGRSVAPAIWNDPSVDWSRAGICVIRSTWDYHLDRPAFLAWAERVAALGPLWNPLPVVRWNSHKGYLRDLEQRGAPVVPTDWLPAGHAADVGAALREREWLRAVIKPAVGLATRGVLMVDLERDGAAAAQSHVDALLREHDVLLQPFLPSVERYGERALVFIDGAYSHAVQKTAFQPLAAAGDAGEVLVEADAEEIAVASAVAAMAPRPVLYARVDLVRGEDGRPLVIEFELVEPSLFLSLYPPAAERFAVALDERIR